MDQTEDTMSKEPLLDTANQNTEMDLFTEDTNDMWAYEGIQDDRIYEDIHRDEVYDDTQEAWSYDNIHEGSSFDDIQEDADDLFNTRLSRVSSHRSMAGVFQEAFEFPDQIEDQEEVGNDEEEESASKGTSNVSDCSEDGFEDTIGLVAILDNSSYMQELQEMDLHRYVLLREARKHLTVWDY